MRSAAGAGAASFAGIGVKRTQDAVARTAAKAIIKVLDLASPVHTAEDSAPFVFTQPSLRNIVGLAVVLIRLRGNPPTLIFCVGIELLRS